MLSLAPALVLALAPAVGPAMPDGTTGVGAVDLSPDVVLSEAFENEGFPLPEPWPEPSTPAGLEIPPWDGMAIDHCAERLHEAGVTDYVFVRRREVVKLPRPRMRLDWDGPEVTDLYCHVPQAMHYMRGPGRIKWTGYLMTTCRMGIAIAYLELVMEEEVRKIWGPGATIRAVRSFGTYNCRRLRDYPWLQSLHSFGSALDIGAIYIDGVGEVNVEEHWEVRLPHEQPKSEFLHNLGARLLVEGIFSNVLTPDYDHGHRNHFHLDIEAPEVPPSAQAPPTHLPALAFQVPRVRPGLEPARPSGGWRGPDEPLVPLPVAPSGEGVSLVEILR